MRFFLGLLHISRACLRGGLRAPMTLMHNAPTHESSLSPIRWRGAQIISTDTLLRVVPHACLAAAAFKHRNQNQKMAAADGINNRNSIVLKCRDSSVTLTSSSLTLTIEKSLQENQLQTKRQRGGSKVGIKKRNSVSENRIHFI